jgi:hypothetical protein
MRDNDGHVWHFFLNTPHPETEIMTREMNSVMKTRRESGGKPTRRI